VRPLDEGLALAESIPLSDSDTALVAELRLVARNREFVDSVLAEE